MRSTALRTTASQFADRVWPADRGYDLVAGEYDRWYWQAFWRANELPLVVRELGACTTGLSALDAGTGTGQYLGVLQQQGYESTGLDVSGEMLRMARRKLGADSHLVLGALESAPLHAEAFDVVIACRVLSHVKRLDVAFKELARVTKPGGRLLLTDVSAEHNYVTTRIPTRSGDVRIQTFKHDTSAVFSSGTRYAGWQVERMEEIRFRDLIAPPSPVDYPSIDVSSGSPIFYFAVMSRTS
ncbi:MAG: class I SAM-dependent methyltransferase [Bryobacterales bacterium]|nr:class I SAM-dependent methyltransferase [Bryobacterales bacterium]